MDDPFAMFAQDVKAAVPSDPSEPPKQQNAFDTFATSSAAQPPPQSAPMMQNTVQPMQMAPPMSSPPHPYSQAPQYGAPPVTANPFGAPVSPVVNPAAPASANPFDSPSAGAAPQANQPPAVTPPEATAAGPMGGPPPNVVPPSSPPPMLPADAPMLPADPPQPATAMVPVETPADPWASAVAPQQPPAPADPFGAPGAPQQMVPWSAPSAQPAAGDDPFSVFGAPQPAAQPTEMQIQPASPPPAQEPTSAVPSADDDMWAQMGFGAPTAAEPTSSGGELVPTTAGGKLAVNDDGLPTGGEYYDVKIHTPSLGIIFFKPKELKTSLYLETDEKIIEALDTRPVVAHILEGSSARSANIELGHVLLKVGEKEVYTPDEAVRAIKESPRPLDLLFYVPKTKVIVSEGLHMVKYDTHDFMAPKHIESWKQKYVVVGGLISKPYLINMYRSKEEYDVAVIEAQQLRKISVKVKQFTLLGATLQKESSPVQGVRYPKKLYPWKYIVIHPRKGYPVKISSTTLDGLNPTLNGVRRTLKEYGKGTEIARRALSPTRSLRDTPGSSYDKRPTSPYAERPSSPYGYDGARPSSPYGYDGARPASPYAPSYDNARPSSPYAQPSYDGGAIVNYNGDDRDSYIRNVASY